MRVRGQRIWLIASVAALFGLLAPPCALACALSLEDASSAAPLDAPPCHEQNPDSTPSEAPSSHEDCACEFTNEVFSPGAAASSSAWTLVAISLSAPQQSLDASMRWALASPKDTDLPSPDILLLKSTLLI